MISTLSSAHFLSPPDEQLITIRKRPSANSNKIGMIIELFGSFPNKNRSIRFAKVRSNRFLTPDSSLCLGLESSRTDEKPYFQDARNLLNGRGKGFDLPTPRFPVNFFPWGHVCLGEQRTGEWGVNEKKVLVRLQRSFLGRLGKSDHGIHATEFLELCQDSIRCNWGHLNRDVFPR